MAWFRIDDQSTFNPKVMRAGNAAYGAWVRMGAYCNSHLTDGYISEEIAQMIASKKELVTLLQSGLLHQAEGGYQIHDYLEYQKSKQQVIVDREATKQRVRKFRNAVTNTVSNTAPSHPIPSNTEQKKTEVPAASAGPPSVKPKKQSKPKPERPRWSEVIATYHDAWVSLHSLNGKPPAIDGADISALARVYDVEGVDETITLIRRFVSDTDPFITQRGHMLRDLPSRVNAYRAKQKPRTCVTSKSNFREAMPHQSETKDETDDL